MIKDKPNMLTFKAILFLLLIFLLEWFLFKAFVGREVAWSPFLNGDANWYLGHSYIVFDSIIKEGRIPPEFFNDPAGIMVLLVSSVLYLFFGTSRLVALSTNFIFYLLWQGILFYAIRYISKSWLLAFVILGLCMTAAVPFQVNSNYMLNITEYQREFVVFCLFGIFITMVLFSDTFLNKKWSIWAGLVAGFMVSFRYNVLFHILGIYFVTLITFFFILLTKRKRDEMTALYMTRIVNVMLSFLFVGAVCGYPLYRARYALYNHYFVGKIVGPKNESFIQLYQQGVKDLWQQIIYYPRIILYSGLGLFFIKTAVIIGVLLLFIVVMNRLLRTRPTAMRNAERVPNSLPFSVPVFYWFLLICVSVPLSLLSTYPVRSGNVGILIAAPCIMFICIFFAHLYSRCAIFNKLLSQVAIVMVVVALVSGMLYQIKCYSLVSISSRNRSDYLEVARMYDDIITISKKEGIKTPGISVNFTENYVLGCGEAITAYQYEHAGELFRIKAKLGSDIGKKIEPDEAIELIQGSDFMLLDAGEEIQGQQDTVKRELLSQNLAEYPFSKSMIILKPIVRKFVEGSFLQKGCYQIFNREVELYINKNIEFRPIAIRASSQMNKHYSADTILDASSAIWHSENTPVYPQWIEFEFKFPVIINNILILCQVGAPERAPSDFYLQGQFENGQWLNLLKVNSAPFKAGNESISWPIENVHAFKHYRLYITKNNGANDLLTIQQIRFGYADNKKK
ncbi:MAG: hypothetical protein ABSE89_09930 [Sedimentisphaerales bacterium]